MDTNIASSADIKFSFEGKNYSVDRNAYDLGRIVLPDSRVLVAEKWLESMPPQPQGLHEFNTRFAVLPKPAAMAILIGGVLARQV